MRADESTARARRQPYTFSAPASNKTRRSVWDWLPIHRWTAAEVWADIHASGVPYHPAYDAGMTRLSCSFCVLGSKADLLLACKLRPEIARQYVAVEESIGHTFQPGRRIAEILAEASSSG